MTRLPRVTARDVERALLTDGFTFSHSRGSHRSYTREGQRVVVPFHGSNVIPPGTLRSILRQASLSVDEFRDLLR
jgi:predicted RNA binding protein YcfA (HicA-like mRNA interferase family)